MLNEKHVRILEGRGHDPEILAKYGVESSSERAFDGIVIPFFEGDRIVNHKRRTIEGEKRFYQDTDARCIFWNVSAISDLTLANEPLIITEGELDALAAIQSGFPRSVSVPIGAPAEAVGDKETKKYKYLDEAPASLADCREIILAVDSDGPGVNLLHDLSLRLGRARCKWVPYPQGCKDLGDALRIYGEKGVRECIRRASWISMSGLYRQEELPPIPERKVYRLDMPVMDDHYRLRLGDFTVLTGIPSHGKSTIINEICCRMAQNFGWRTAFASFEQQPQTDHLRSLRTWFNRKLVAWQTPEEVAAADAWVNDHFLFVVPDEDEDATLAWVMERCKTAVIRYGVKIVVIDPWNEIEHDRPPDTTETEYVATALRTFRRFARKFMVHLIVAAHPTKQPKLTSGDFAMPTLYDISGSANWYNKCDIGMVIHRTSEGTVLRIAKSRHHDEIGTPGDVPVNFCRETGRYEVADAEEQLPMAG